MGRITTLRDLIGAIKDKASILSKAAIVSKPQTISLHLAVLRVTAHTPSTPPDDHHISTLLSLGDSSRCTASALVSSLMDRLRRTGNSTVALKCLLTIHHIIKRGPFILQDQLSIFPATGGYNYLKLSGFRDTATASTWVLSAWVRWYARYIETLLGTSRVLGCFLCSSSCTQEKDKEEERISSLLNEDLIRDIDALVGLIEEVCKLPDPHFIEGNKLLSEIIILLTNDYLSIINEILPRLSEFDERMRCLSFGQSVEAVFALKRLKDCKEKMSVIFTIKKPSMEKFWDLIDKLKDEIEMLNVYKEERKLLRWGKSDKGSESARFEGPYVKINDSVLFPSGRISVKKVSLLAVESVDSTI